MLPSRGNPPDMNQKVPVYTIKAERNRSRFDRARRKVQPLVAKTRASLKFRNEDRAEDELARRRGNLDDGGVHKLALGDAKVFRQTDIISAPRVDVGILVDESGSMSGTKEAVARETAILLVQALKGMRGVRVSVWGHTGECEHATDGVLIRRYIEVDKGEVDSLGSLSGRSQNFDGYAVSWSAQRMVLQGAGVPNKVLFVLLDGYPCGAVYGGVSALDHVRHVVTSAARAGVHVFGIGVGGDVNKEGLEYMYGKHNWVHILDVAKTPLMIAKLMKRVLRYGNV
jgi:cobalamin biosynthesis protein CobT